MENLSNEDRMHGSIFVFLKRFVESSYDYSTWVKLAEKAGLEHSNFQMHEMYPTSELYKIVATASEMTGISQSDLQEKFGKFLVPDLLLIYKKHINPNWKTFEMLQYTEAVMHGAVRSEDNRTTPPILFVTKVSNSLLVIDYHSKRRMACVAIGIIKGIATYFGEGEKVQVVPVTDSNAERVQIKVHFINN